MRRRLAITNPFIPANVDVLLTVEEVQARVAALADRLAPIVSQGSWTGVVTLMGAVPFAADLLRALAARGVDLGFDALWLESYHDERVSSGRIVVRADISRSVAPSRYLVGYGMDDAGKMRGLPFIGAIKGA